MRAISNFNTVCCGESETSRVFAEEMPTILIKYIIIARTRICLFLFILIFQYNTEIPVL